MSEADALPPHDVCELCGRPAIVHLTQERFAGPARMRHLCGECADKHPFDGMADDDAAPRAARSLAELMILTGVVFTGMTLGADYFGVGDQPGFGTMQMTGVLAGVVLVVLGALFRSDLLSVAGGVLTVLACLADWLSLGTIAVSRKQTAAIMAAVVVTMLGAWIRMRRRRSSPID